MPVIKRRPTSTVTRSPITTPAHPVPAGPRSGPTARWANSSLVARGPGAFAPGPPFGSTAASDVGSLRTAFPMHINRARMEAALPGYDIGQLIGQGGFGLVFACRHRQLNAARAIKAVVLPDVDAHAVSARSLTEAQIMTELDHPHLVRVFEYAERQELRLLVMEYLTGGTLAARIQQGLPRPEVACAWALAVADGLQAAHERGIVHRDVKPENVLFTADGVPKVCDFGIAKLFDNSRMSASAGFMGTPMYVSPEQIRGERVGPGTDIYALGVTLYRLLTGRTPFPKSVSFLNLIQYHLHEPPAPMDDVPLALAAVVRRALAKDRSDRQASAREFAHDLSRAAHDGLGPSWIDRAGVPLRVHHSLLREPPAAGWGVGDGRPTGRGATDGVSSGPNPRPPAAETGITGTGIAVARASRDSRKRRTAMISAGVVAALVVTATTTWGLARSHGADTLTSPAAAPRRAASAAPAATDRQASAPPSPATTPIRASATPRSAEARQVIALTGFAGTLNAVAYSPNGKLVAGAGSDGKVRLWDTGTGTPAAPAFTGHTDGVNAVAFSPDGRTLATAGGDRTIRLWNVQTGAQIGAPLTGHTAGIAAITFSSDGTRLASGGADNTIRLWSVTSHAQLTPALTGHTKTVRSVSFSPDGRRLASSSNDGTIRLWNPATGTEVGAPLTGHGSWVETVAFSPDGTVLASASDDRTVRLWNVATAQQSGAPLDVGAPASAVAFSPDGSRLASGSDDHLVRFWSVRSHTQIGSPLTGLAGNVSCVVFSPNNDQLAATDDSGSVVLYRLS
ncbi:WD40 repeat domain-containing serine/threonine protein kinase [Cryptosporangium sp. NPDC051539]|uniref:WD40 repeat domain-containing serine/threonine protein kinase n=1 Tax=Cryptosporangium sp. NPDC051539 TaxID=3363962 RepID=UPI00379F95D3